MNEPSFRIRKYNLNANKETAIFERLVTSNPKK